MKLGIIISVVLLIVLGLLGFVAFRGVADGSSNATASEMLVKMDLPSDLPPLFISSVPNGNAARTYDKAIELYVDHRREFNSEMPRVDLINTLVSLLIDAVQHERVNQGFLDKHVPVQPGATPDFDDALESIPGIVLARADEMYQDGNAARAVLAARAVWAFGQRAFQNNTRLYIRIQGLAIMLDAGDKLFQWTSEVGDRGAKNVREWMAVAHEIDQRWRGKYELIARLKPRVGDLLNIAQNDEDPSFRIAAILKLGLTKFHPGGRGNMRMITATIEDAKGDSNALIVQAGIAAAGLTRDQMRKIN